VVYVLVQVILQVHLLMFSFFDWGQGQPSSSVVCFILYLYTKLISQSLCLLPPRDLSRRTEKSLAEFEFGSIPWDRPPTAPTFSPDWHTPHSRFGGLGRDMRRSITARGFWEFYDLLSRAYVELPWFTHTVALCRRPRLGQFNGVCSARWSALENA
jgi:hypothetical protein